MWHLLVNHWLLEFWEPVVFQKSGCHLWLNGESEKKKEENRPPLKLKNNGYVLFHSPIHGLGLVLFMVMVLGILRFFRFVFILWFFGICMDLSDFLKDLKFFYCLSVNSFRFLFWVWGWGFRGFGCRVLV